jgi:hypothetical protein
MNPSEEQEHSETASCKSDPVELEEDENLSDFIDDSEQTEPTAQSDQLLYETQGEDRYLLCCDKEALKPYSFIDEELSSEDNINFDEEDTIDERPRNQFIGYFADEKSNEDESDEESEEPEEDILSV